MLYNFYLTNIVSLLMFLLRLDLLRRSVLVQGSQEKGGIFTRIILRVLRNRVGPDNSQIENYYEELRRVLMNTDEASRRCSRHYVDISGQLSALNDTCVANITWIAYQASKWLGHYWQLAAASVVVSLGTLLELFFKSLAVQDGVRFRPYFIATGSASASTRQPSMETVGSFGRTVGQRCINSRES